MNKQQGNRPLKMDKTDASQIDAHWREEKKYSPNDNFIKHANMKDPSIYEYFETKNFPQCFRAYADMLDWYKPYNKILDSSSAPFWRWYVGGQLNACYNCIDRHLPKYAHKPAFIFVPESEEEAHKIITYEDLYKKVNEVAVLLKKVGLKKGDRITFHLPMTLELPIMMLACARLGIIHAQVFGGFSGQACGERIKDSGSRILVTMDAYWRSGKLIDHKVNADIAVKTANKMGQKVDKVLVWQRYPGKYSSKTPMVKGRDVFINNLLSDLSGRTIRPVIMDSNSPLFLMYTSGTTGKPKGIQHGTGGYMAYVTATSKWILDIHPEDIYWCMADIGWITGHSYIVYGPLSVAGTSVIYEGTPTFPDVGRTWRIAEQLKVNIFHTSPTAIRMLRKLGPKEPSKYNYHFKSMTTVGEPIEPKVWRWYYKEVGKSEAVITDTWWQSETGGFLCSIVPALKPMKPGSTGPGLPGIYPTILDEDGKEVPVGPSHAGNLCIRNPWPGAMQTIWGDDARYLKTYYSKYNKNPNSTDWRDWPYMTGDGALKTNDNYIRILGRVDDVINVAGHRLGAKEIESACLTVPEITEAAVVAMKDEIKGHVPVVYISLKQGIEPGQKIIDSMIKTVERLIGKIATPKYVYIVTDMPKTRSGKIMRRVLASIVNNMDTGDISTLSNPEIVQEIRALVQD